MNDLACKLLFLATHHFREDNATRGAFLLTDGETKPLEFRCTDPIRPSTLQSVLYGDMLRRHILVELVGAPLVKAVTEDLTVILVSDPEFLELRSRINVPMILIGNDRQVANLDTENSFEMLSSTSGKFEPIVFTSNPHFPDDAANVREMLAAIFSRNNLLEPFSRIAKALDQVHQQKVGGRTAP